MQEWNHNTHHHRTLLRLLPLRPKAALDVGSGDGSFTALLSQRCDTVLAIDTDPVQVEATRRRCAGLPNVRVEEADFLTGDLPSGEFDVVTALASLHHMPFEAAATTVTRVLRPGGRLVVLGVWTNRTTAWDVVLNLISMGINRVLRRWRGPDVMTAPATMPAMTFREVEQAARQCLPGVRIRRRTLWRYTLTWAKPTALRPTGGVP
jgi:ubiquinone/menaquinone biosynthesis C-methylase UbiE